jgi:hypothetical protein
MERCAPFLLSSVVGNTFRRPSSLLCAARASSSSSSALPSSSPACPSSFSFGSRRGLATLSTSAKAKAEKAKRQEKKKTVAQLVRVRQGPTFHLDEAVRILKAAGVGPADQTVDLQIQLGIDPRKTNVVVRGVATLPHGTGKSVVVAVFARGDKAEEARKAGAQFVGAEDLVERINKGELSFNRTIATPDVMPLVGRVARVRGVWGWGGGGSHAPRTSHIAPRPSLSHSPSSCLVSPPYLSPPPCRSWAPAA